MKDKDAFAYSTRISKALDALHIIRADEIQANAIFLL